jgi:hypothetical protein
MTINLNNGQFVASVAVLVDAIFGVLYTGGVVHVQPDQSLVLSVTGVVMNGAAALLAYIQHSQHLAATPKA